MSLLLHKVITHLYNWSSNRYTNQASEGRYKIVEVLEHRFNPGLRNVFSKERKDLSFKYPLPAKSREELLGKEIEILESPKCYTFRRNTEGTLLGSYGANIKESGMSEVAKVKLDGEELYLDTGGLTFKVIEKR